jgi:hypothetical protein
MPEFVSSATARRAIVERRRLHRRTRVQPHRRSHDRRIGDAKLLRKFGNVPDDLSAL